MNWSIGWCSRVDDSFSFWRLIIKELRLVAMLRKFYSHFEYRNYMLTFRLSFWMPAWTYFTTLLRLLWSVIGPFSWSSSMKKSAKDWRDHQQRLRLRELWLAAYLYDCLAPPACRPAPTSHGNSLSNWRRRPGADKLDEPKTIEERKNVSIALNTSVRRKFTWMGIM